MKTSSMHSMSSPDVISLSASYSGNPSTELTQYKRVDFSPVRYDYPDEGFTLFQHEMFSGIKDERFSNKSFFGLTSGISMSDMIDDYRGVGSEDLVVYTTLAIFDERARSLKLLKNINNKLYAVTSPGKETRANLFKIYKRDGYFMVSQGELFATVDLLFNQFTIRMRPYVSTDIDGSSGKNTQKFWVRRGGPTNRIMLYSMIKNTWDLIKDVYSNGRTPPVHRFWSIYDGAVRPKHVYDGEVENLVKINGGWKDTLSGVSSIEGYNKLDNRYTFVVDSKYVDGFDVVAMGFNGKMRWVRYHNNFYDKFWNSDVTPQEVIDSVRPNFLVEFPYKTSATRSDDDPAIGDMAVNVATLKTVMTPEYNYTVKQISGTEVEEAT